MFEHISEPLASKTTLVIRLVFSILFAYLLIGITLFIGMFGYHNFEKMSWVDAFVNAAMILSGMGPLGNLSSDAGKIFAGCYALFSGLAFIVLIGVMFAPIVHRFFHKLHLDVDDGKQDE